MASVEDDFPRGGPVKKTSELKTTKTTKPRVEVDNLFEVSNAQMRKHPKTVLSQMIAWEQSLSDTELHFIIDQIISFVQPQSETPESPNIKGFHLE